MGKNNKKDKSKGAGAGAGGRFGGPHKAERRPVAKQSSMPRVSHSPATNAHRPLPVPTKPPSIAQNAPQAASGGGGGKLSALQLQFKKKLEGARFRTINEKLYTCRGDDAFTDFQTEPELFDVVSISSHMYTFS